MAATDDFSRRDFISIGVTAGVALAVHPPMASALMTDTGGILTEEISFPSGDTKINGYLAMPKGNGPFPTVLLVHEIFGVHAYIQDVCRRLAKQGYLAVAPYLYARQGDVTALKEINDIRTNIISKVVQTQVWTDLDETVGFVVKNKKADPKRLGITGFCWGGSVTWMYAAHNPHVKAGVAWYGKLVGDATPIHSKFPVDIAQNLSVPVLGLYGGKDKSIPLDSIEKMKGLLERGKSGSTIRIYDEADHGFHADYRPTYNEKAAKDGWEKALAWFKKYL